MSNELESSLGINITSLSDSWKEYIWELLEALTSNNSLLVDIILNFDVTQPQHVSYIISEYVWRNHKQIILDKIELIQLFFERDIARLVSFWEFYELFQEFSSFFGELNLECIINLSSELEDNPELEFVGPIFYDGNANNIHCMQEEIIFQVDSMTSLPWEWISLYEDYQLFQIFINSKLNNGFISKILWAFMYKFNDLMVLKNNEVKNTLNPLTGLRNKNALNILLESEFNKQQDLSYCFIDLNNFKHINDSYGHENGDTVIKDVADILYKMAIENDGYAANMWGDEFALVLPWCDYQSSIRLGEEIISRISNIWYRFEKDNVWNYFNITPSISMVTRDKTTSQKLWRWYDLPKFADVLLEAAKEKSSIGGEQSNNIQRSAQKFNWALVHANDQELNLDREFLTYLPISRYMNDNEERKKQLLTIINNNWFRFNLKWKHPKELGILHSDICLLETMEIDHNILLEIMKKCWY